MQKVGECRDLDDSELLSAGGRRDRVMEENVEFSYNELENEENICILFL